MVESDEPVVELVARVHAEAVEAAEKVTRGCTNVSMRVRMRMRGAYISMAFSNIKMIFFSI